MNIEMKTGWVHRDLLYLSGDERWVFTEDKPDGEEEYVASEDIHRPALIRQIVYAYVDTLQVTPE